MVKRAIVLVGVGLASLLGAAGSAHAFGVGLGVPAAPVPTPPAVAPAVDSVVSGVGNVVAGTAPDVVSPAAPDSPDFAGRPDVPAGNAPAASYKAFENLVNNVEGGGGSGAPVVSGDVFSGGGVDGGVPGVPDFPPIRVVR